jgi:hypothetical protein
MNLLYQYAYDGFCAKSQWKAAAGSIGFLYCHIVPTRELQDVLEKTLPVNEKGLKFRRSGSTIRCVTEMNQCAHHIWRINHWLETWALLLCGADRIATQHSVRANHLQSRGPETAACVVCSCPGCAVQSGRCNLGWTSAGATDCGPLHLPLHSSTLPP